MPQLAIKTEKDENWENESQQVHEVEEEITIKTVGLLIIRITTFNSVS